MPGVGLKRRCHTAATVHSGSRFDFSPDQLAGRVAAAGLDPIRKAMRVCYTEERIQAIR